MRTSLKREAAWEGRGTGADQDGKQAQQGRPNGTPTQATTRRLWHSTQIAGAARRTRGATLAAGRPNHLRGSMMTREEDGRAAQALGGRDGDDNDNSVLMLGNDTRVGMGGDGLGGGGVLWAAASWERRRRRGRCCRGERFPPDVL